MILKYTTSRLPPTFIYLGLMLSGLGIWRMVILDWKGILYFLLAMVLLFIKSGIVIDSENRIVKKYDGFFFIKKGQWESIASVIDLHIIKTTERHHMNVASISRSETIEVYQLVATLPDQDLELMTGKMDVIINRTEKIASLLQIPIRK